MGRTSVIAALIGLAVAASGAAAQSLATKTQDELFEIQRALRDAGCYNGSLDGRLTRELQTASQNCPSLEPVLRIETGMHTAGVNRVGVDRECRLLATGSDDKTVRLWSLPDGRLIRTQRLPIGEGNLGKVYSVALSPDGTLVAAAGWDSMRNVIKGHGIYLFDAKTGSKMRHVGVFGNVINHLAFSPDGKRIAASLGSGGIRVLDVNSGDVLMSDTEFDNDADSYGVAFGPDGTLYAVGDDGYVRRYDRGNLKRTARVKTLGGDEPYSVAVHPTEDLVAIGYADSTEVEILDGRTLRRRVVVDTNGMDRGNLGRVSFTPDGKRLIAGGRFSKPMGETELRIPVRIWDLQGKQIGSDVSISSDTILALVPCGGAVLFGAGDPSFGFISGDGQLKILAKSLVPDMRGKKRNGFTVSPDGMRVRFGMNDAGSGQTVGESPVLFDVSKGTLDEAPDAIPGLRTPDITGLKVEGWENSRGPTLNGNKIELKNYEIARALAVRPQRDGLILAADWTLRRITAEGDEPWQIEVPSTAWGVNLARNGDLVIAAYGDGTIRWHRWSDGKELLALFVHKQTKRWVAWTPSGYYMADAGAEDLIGWHVNRGWEQPPDFFPVARFRDRFLRPDIVREVLKTLDEDEAIRKANEAAKRQDRPKPLIEQLPPVIRITNFGEGQRYPFQSDSLELNYEVRSPSGRSIERIDFLIDGRPYQSKALEVRQTNTSAPQIGTVKVTDLPARDIKVALIAWTGQQSSVAAQVEFNWTGQEQKVTPKPRLFALLIGVSNYTEQGLSLGFAAKDATDLANALKAQVGKTYQDVQVRVVTAAAGTQELVKREDILDGLDWLEKQKTNPDDVSVVYLAGHGVTDSGGNYWFLPSNVSTTRLNATGLSQDDIERTLRKLKNRVLLFLDTCYAGGALMQSGLRIEMNSVVNRFSATETGVIAFASSTSTELSGESASLQNGIFTRALLEGLFDYKANLMGDGEITPSLLYAYIYKRVTVVTNQKQKPIMVRPSTVPEFPIMLVRN